MFTDKFSAVSFRLKAYHNENKQITHIAIIILLLILIFVVSDWNPAKKSNNSEKQNSQSTSSSWSLANLIKNQEKGINVAPSSAEKEEQVKALKENQQTYDQNQQPEDFDLFKAIWDSLSGSSSSNSENNNNNVKNRASASTPTSPLVIGEFPTSCPEVGTYVSAWLEKRKDAMTQTSSIPKRKAMKKKEWVIVDAGSTDNGYFLQTILETFGMLKKNTRSLGVSLYQYAESVAKSSKEFPVDASKRSLLCGSCCSCANPISSALGKKKKRERRLLNKRVTLFSVSPSPFHLDFVNRYFHEILAERNPLLLSSSSPSQNNNNNNNMNTQKSLLEILQSSDLRDKPEEIIAALNKIKTAQSSSVSMSVSASDNSSSTSSETDTNSKQQKSSTADDDDPAATSSILSDDDDTDYQLHTILGQLASFSQEQVQPKQTVSCDITGDCSFDSKQTSGGRGVASFTVPTISLDSILPSSVSFIDVLRTSNPFVSGDPSRVKDIPEFASAVDYRHVAGVQRLLREGKVGLYIFDLASSSTSPTSSSSSSTAPNTEEHLERYLSKLSNWGYTCYLPITGSGGGFWPETPSRTLIELSRAGNHGGDGGESSSSSTLSSSSPGWKKLYNYFHGRKLSVVCVMDKSPPEEYGKGSSSPTPVEVRFADLNQAFKQTLLSRASTTYTENTQRAVYKKCTNSKIVQDFVKNPKVLSLNRDWSWAFDGNQQALGLDPNAAGQQQQQEMKRVFVRGGGGGGGSGKVRYAKEKVQQSGAKGHRSESYKKRVSGFQEKKKVRVKERVYSQPGGGAAAAGGQYVYVPVAKKNEASVNIGKADFDD